MRSVRPRKGEKALSVFPEENRRKPISLRRQALLFLCLLLLPFSILSAILSIRTMRNLESQYSRQTRAILDSYAAQLAHRINMSDYLLLNLFTNI